MKDREKWMELCRQASVEQDPKKNTMIVFYRCMGEPQPGRLANWARALIEHIGRRHD
jgi:hypothetical protein